MACVFEISCAGAYGKTSEKRHLEILCNLPLLSSIITIAVKDFIPSFLPIPVPSMYNNDYVSVS